MAHRLPTAHVLPQRWASTELGLAPDTPTVLELLMLASTFQVAQCVGKTPLIRPTLPLPLSSHPTTQTDSLRSYCIAQLSKLDLVSSSGSHALALRAAVHARCFTAAAMLFGAVAGDAGAVANELVQDTQVGRLSALQATNLLAQLVALVLHAHVSLMQRQGE